MIRDAWLGCDWVGTSMPVIDPVKEAVAAEKWNALGIYSLADISAQQGKDFDRTHSQLVREKRMREAGGLVLVPAPGASGGNQQAAAVQASLMAMLLEDDK
jgi:capsid protein